MEGKHYNQLKIYQCTQWFEDVVHGFPTKLGGHSQGDWEGLNLATGRGDQRESVKQNYREICDALGISPVGFARNLQVHGKKIHRVSWEDSLDLDAFVTPSEPVPEGDGLLTDEKGVMLWAYSADCVPILYHDPVKKVIGAVHAGWRGTAQGIALEMVEEMGRVFESKPEDIRVAIGPSIGPCCFMCSEDVPIAMREALGQEVEPFMPPHPTEKEKFSVDLQGINGLWLKRGGVIHIDQKAPCTACHTEEFWSHRKQGEKRGALGGFIYLPKEGEMP